MPSPFTGTVEVKTGVVVHPVVSFGPKGEKVIVPVGTLPPVRWATSWMANPWSAPAGAVVVSVGDGKLVPVTVTL
ncbi:MAG: hypothetical protein ACRDYC_01025 [Acidimicrobiales bacterium]